MSQRQRIETENREQRQGVPEGGNGKGGQSYKLSVTVTR